jgi:hypothetical protein
MPRFFIYLSMLIRNWWSRSPVTDPSAGVVVTLTSHGGRLRQAFAAIESIGSGVRRPARIILYLNEKNKHTELPVSLKKLAARGLEICYCEDVGPHTKYYPYLMSEPWLDLPLVTADDDKLYGKDWLKTLVDRSKDQPEFIHCYRAREIRINQHGIEPYWNWPECESDQPSFLHFATGVSGVIYPPSFQKVLKKAGDEFRELCPKADDIWLHVMALRHGYPVRQINHYSVEYPGIPGSSRYALRRTNVDECGNDKQIARTYLPDDIHRLHKVAGQS